MQILHSRLWLWGGVTLVTILCLFFVPNLTIEGSGWILAAILAAIIIITNCNLEPVYRHFRIPCTGFTMAIAAIILDLLLVMLFGMVLGSPTGIKFYITSAYDAFMFAFFVGMAVFFMNSYLGVESKDDYY